MPPEPQKTPEPQLETLGAPPSAPAAPSVISPSPEPTPVPPPPAPAPTPMPATPPSAPVAPVVPVPPASPMPKVPEIKTNPVPTPAPTPTPAGAPVASAKIEQAPAPEPQILEEKIVTPASVVMPTPQMPPSSRSVPEFKLDQLDRSAAAPAPKAPEKVKLEQSMPQALAEQKPHAGAGPIVGVIIIVFMLALGGLYFWGAQLNRQQETLPLIPGNATAQ